jgi:NO-binding membrane sensor protein with MHYT domain
MNSKYRTLLTIAIGLCITCIALVITRRTNLSDFVKGICFGIGIGVMALPLARRSVAKDNYGGK